MTVSKAALSLVLLASLLALVPAAAGAQQQGGLEVDLPPNTDCRGAAVISKATVTEDAAAANMLAEALRVLSPGGAQRCLLDAGLPSQGRAPDPVFRSSAGLASKVYVVGGPAAIPDEWLEERFGVTSFVRVAGVDRWRTQENVAAAIIALANERSVVAWDPSASAERGFAPNGSCSGTAVLAKTSVREELAAANMLAVTLTAISGDPDSRCLIDAGDPSKDTPPNAVALAEALQPSGVYLLGGVEAVPEQWIENHFDIRFLERLDGSDRWATQSRVAQEIINIARGGTLPHQETNDDGEIVSVYRNLIILESATDPAPVPSDITLKQGVTQRSVPVWYCAEKTRLDAQSGRFNRSSAASYLAEEVARLNQYVTQFFEDQTSGRLIINFTGGQVISPPSAKNVDWTAFTNKYRIGPEPKDISNDLRPYGASRACLEEAQDAASAGDGAYLYVLVDQVGAGGWSSLGDGGGAQPIRNGASASMSYEVFAHELGHGILKLCHPHDLSSYPWASRCDPRHWQVAAEPALQGYAVQAGRNRGYQSLVEQQHFGNCSLMSYCRGVHGPINDPAINLGGRVWISCGQRRLLGVLPGPTTRYGDCPSTTTASAPDAPAAPAVVPAAREIAVSWRVPPGNGAAITEQQVRWRPHGMTWDTPAAAVSASATRYTISGLNSGVAYEVQVRARNSEGWGPWSAAAVATTQEQASVPDAPRGVSAGSGDPQVAEQEIVVRWSPAISNGAAVDRYEVRWRRASGGSWSSGSVGASAAGFWMTGLASDTSFEIQVRARNSVGWGPWSATVSASTERVASVPDAPGGVSVSGGDGSVTVSWRVPPGNGAAITEQQIRWRQASGGSWTSASPSASATSFTISGLRDGTDYQVQVRAQNSEGWGAWSQSATATTDRAQPQASVSISAGSVNRSRSDSNSCGGNDCHDLSYDIQGLGSGPYTLECWFDGQRAWRGTWSGRASAGCYYWSTFSGTIQVVIDGVASNTITVTGRAPRATRSVVIAHGPVNASRTNNGSCGGNDCHDLSYDIRGLGSGPYTLECWFDGQRAWRGTWSGRASAGCYYWSTFSGTIQVVIDGVTSNIIRR